MKASLVALIAVVLILVVALFAGGSYISTKNHIVQLNEDVNGAYSQVSVVQQRRLDLIPNLVASVKGYVKEEETVLADIASARAGVVSSAGNRGANIQANSRLDAAILPLFRLQEAYPDLKGNQQFMRLEDELAGTENRIATERRRYNESLKAYDIYIQQFPNSLWAGIAGYHYRDEYFKGNPANNVAPTVDFSK